MPNIIVARRIVFSAPVVAAVVSGGATARSATVMDAFGPVMVNTSTTQRDANADGVMVNSR